MRVVDIARALGYAPDTIRQLERRGVLPAPRRDRLGHRRYSERDLAEIRRILFPSDSQHRGGAHTAEKAQGRREADGKP